MVNGAVREWVLTLLLEAGMLSGQNGEPWPNVLTARMAGPSAEIELFDYTADSFLDAPAK
jgi:hypothetical protein